MPKRVNKPSKGIDEEDSEENDMMSLLKGISHHKKSRQSKQELSKENAREAVHGATALMMETYKLQIDQRRHTLDAFFNEVTALNEEKEDHKKNDEEMMKLRNLLKRKIQLIRKSRVENHEVFKEIAEDMFQKSENMNDALTEKLAEIVGTSNDMEFINIG